MENRTPDKLRDKASMFRMMAEAGDDPHIQQALLLVADEFEQEAAQIEAENT